MQVTESILKFQREFFDKGTALPKPLILRDVAEDIGMHESTVSRVTTNKYVHTPQGIFELKYFFNSGIARSDGDDLASEAVKLKIKQIIAGEDPSTRTPTRRSSSCWPTRASRSPAGRSPSTASSLASCRAASAGRSSRRTWRTLAPLRAADSAGLRLSAEWRPRAGCSSPPRSATWTPRRRSRPTPRSGWRRSASTSTAIRIAAHATFAVERNHNHMAEFQITLPNGIVIQARETTEDMYSSIDLAGARIERQVRKWKDKIRDHKPHGGPSFSVRERVIEAGTAGAAPRAGRAGPGPAGRGAGGGGAPDGPRREAAGKPCRRGQPAARRPALKVIKEQTFTVRPMRVDDAVMQMNLLENEFFVFLDVDTKAVSVVYRRKDGNYGLIETGGSCLPGSDRPLGTSHWTSQLAAAWRR